MRKMERVPGIFKRQWDISITMGILNGVVISTLNISKPRIGNYLVYSHEQKPFAVYVTCFFQHPPFSRTAWYTLKFQGFLRPNSCHTCPKRKGSSMKLRKKSSEVAGWGMVAMWNNGSTMGAHKCVNILYSSIIYIYNIYNIYI
jgi:hypothetical protein